MLLLSFDTSGNACSVALSASGTVLAEKNEAMTRGHAGALIPFIEEVLETAGKTFQDLEALAVTIGPGSFTGIRVGLATAKGLSLALKIPLVGFTSFDVLSFVAQRELSPKVPYILTIDTKREDLYVAAYEAEGQTLLEPTSLYPQEILEKFQEKEVLLTGSGLAYFNEITVPENIKLQDICCKTSARTLVEMFEKNYGGREKIAPEPVEAFYLRPSVVKKV